MTRDEKILKGLADGLPVVVCIIFAGAMLLERFDTAAMTVFVYLFGYVVGYINGADFTKQLVLQVLQDKLDELNKLDK